MAGAEGAQGAALRGAAPFGGRALQEEVADGRGEPGVGAHGGGPGDREAQLGGLGGGFGVEVVLDLHVVGDEPDGGHHDGRDARGVPLLQVVADVRLQPGDVRGAAAGLVDEPPGVVHTGLRTDGFRDHPCHVQVLGDISAALAVLGVVGGGAGGVGCGGGDGVRGEGQMGAVPHLLGQGGERRQHTVGHRADEAGVVEVVPQLVDLRHRQTLGPEGGEGVGEVLAVLAAARVRGVGTGRQYGDTAVPVVDHRAQGVGQVGRPVAVAPVDGQVQAVLGEVLAQCVQQFPVLRVDGADAVEQEVVLPHLLETLAGDAASTGDVLQEGDDVVGAFGTAEGQQQQGVIRAGIALFGHAIDPATLPTGAAGRSRRREDPRAPEGVAEKPRRTAPPRP